VAVSPPCTAISIFPLSSPTDSFFFNGDAEFSPADGISDSLFGMFTDSYFGRLPSLFLDLFRLSFFFASLPRHGSFLRTCVFLPLLGQLSPVLFWCRPVSSIFAPGRFVFSFLHVYLESPPQQGGLYGSRREISPPRTLYPNAFPGRNGRGPLVDAFG